LPGGNFTAGVREREDANRTREAGHWHWECQVCREATLQRERFAGELCDGRPRALCESV